MLVKYKLGNVALFIFCPISLQRTVSEIRMRPRPNSISAREGHRNLWLMANTYNIQQETISITIWELISTF